MTQPAFPGAGGLVPVSGPVLLRRRTSALAIVTMVLLGVGGLLIALMVFLTGGPVAALVTTILAAISFPLLILLCFWLDRYEPEPTRYRIAALGWGGVAAVAIGGGLTALAVAVTGSSEAVAIAVWAPICEEFAKGLFLVLILILRRDQLHGLLDGIIYAALVGIGFAFTEDVLYYLSALTEAGVGGLTATFILRGVISPFAHPLFTAATGVGIGISVMARGPALRLAAPLIGYAVAVLLHAIWNGSTVYGGQGSFWLAYAGIMLPVLVFLIAVAVWARRQEGRMLGSGLLECAQMGWIDPREVAWVARLSDRMAARSYARRVGGKPAVLALREYQQALTEMAFLHNRVIRGSAPRDFQQRMLEIRTRAAALRPYVVLPPTPVGLGGDPGPGPYPGPPQSLGYSPIPGSPPALPGQPGPYPW